MKVEIYDCNDGTTLEIVELPASEVPEFVNLVKAFGFDDSDGEEHKFSSASVCKGGFMVYVVQV